MYSYGWPSILECVGGISCYGVSVTYIAMVGSPY